MVLTLHVETGILILVGEIMVQQETIEIGIGNEVLNIDYSIIQKYNQSGPRYTSYPTIAEWKTGFSVKDVELAIEKSNLKQRPLSLYFHIPFCQSLCLYCACTKVISKNHDVSSRYLDGIKWELEWLASHIDATRPILQIHLGGGTPTFLSSEQLSELFSCIKKHFSIAKDAEISIEIDPRVTTFDQLQVLRQLGFNRISLGIQDFDKKVQQTVHRIQSFEMIEKQLTFCRNLGFESINTDLIYGLPHQTLDSFAVTLEKILALCPDRIALFSYAHVPWMKRQQKSLEPYLPSDNSKLAIFSYAIKQLTTFGYRYIGLDHFALDKDELCQAQDNRTLHRNFQGYTTKSGCDLYGIGMSAISNLSEVYTQNYHTLPEYYAAIDQKIWPTMKGFFLSDEDKLRRSVITKLLCYSTLIKSEIEQEFQIKFDEHFSDELLSLKELEKDGLLKLHDEKIEISTLGRIFVRNISMAFDKYLKKSGEKRFSKTV